MAGEERRQSDARWREAMLIRMVAQETTTNELSGRVTRIENEILTVDAALKTNTIITRQIADDTAALREIQNEAAAALKFLCRLAKWWRFVIRYFVIPVGGMIMLPYLVIYWLSHNYTLPIWTQRLLDIWR